MNYFRFYMGDYAKKTQHLSPLQHGMYFLLLKAQYGTEDALPEDMGQLFRVCGASDKSERDAVVAVVNQFFPVVDGGRWNPRARREIEKAQKAIQAMSDAGKTGAKKRWGREDDPIPFPKGRGKG